jgi:dihydroflavonol-4-reductase
MSGETVFLTGATGFVGSHVRAALLDGGYRVRALVRPDARSLPYDERCVAVEGDLRAPGTLVRAMDGCRSLVHVAALYTFMPGAGRQMRAVNETGTAGLLEAARQAGVERAVVTSSSATVGPMRGDRPATEADWAEVGDGDASYHASKVREERVAFSARVPLVQVLPTAPVGGGDWKPTPTGKMIVDFMKGRMVASLPGGMNVVPVEDVARAHVLALERGRAGERYLVGGENLLLRDLWVRLAAIIGTRPPARELPYFAALATGLLDTARCRVLPNRQPIAPLEGVRMGRERMFVSDARARRELGYTSGSVSHALEEAVRWFRDAGYA